MPEPSHEPTEVEPTRLEATVLNAYLQELVGCEGVQRIDQWTWVVQGWDERGCILKASSSNAHPRGEY